MITLKHYPDKPYERGPSAISTLDNGRNACEQKVDGYRMEIIIVNDDVEFVSRHNKLFTDQIESELKRQAKHLASVFPYRTQIDCEWLSRRAATKDNKIRPQLILFDVIRHGNKWLLRTVLKDRYKILVDGINKIETILIPDISLAVRAEPGSFVDFYELQKKIPYSEGVVIKALRSTIVGDRKECKKNPHWIKIKYRGASDGEMRMDHLR